jgi:hypothetical protein
MLRQRLEAAMFEIEHTRRFVDVYLYAGACRGSLLLAGQQRISDFLSSEREQIIIDDATVARVGGGAVAAGRRVVIEKREVLFVVDLQEDGAAALSAQVVQRERVAVVVGVGPYWVQGFAHLPPGGSIELLFHGTLSQFLPLTDARLVSQPNASLRTFLINREHRHSLIT